MSLKKDVSNVFPRRYTSKKECEKNRYVKVAREEDRITKLDESENTYVVCFLDSKC